MIVDALRPPLPLDPTRAAYKDWLHLNVFDPHSGLVALLNASLHGAPENAQSRAIGTALGYLPDAGWVGNVEVAGYADAVLAPESFEGLRIPLATLWERWDEAVGESADEKK